MTQAADRKSSVGDARFTPDEVIARQRNRQLLVVAVAIVVLAALAAVTRLTRDTEPQIVEVPIVGGADEQTRFRKESVSSIELSAGSEQIRLLRDGGKWRMPDYFNAVVDGHKVDSLLSGVSDAKRLNRPNIVQPERFVLFRLDDDRGARLKLRDEAGNLLLDAMVGRPETGTRTFIRYLSGDVPGGAYEVTSQAGQLDSLYTHMNLDGEGKPLPRRWLDLTGFRPLPFSAVVDQISIREGERELTFSRIPGVDDTQDEWELTAPYRVRANGANVRGVIDALMNLNAQDIAGAVETRGAELGVIHAEREIRIEYRDDGQRSVRLFFGKRSDNRVAVLLKRVDTGELVHWCPDFALTRMFRPTGEFLDAQRIVLVPDGILPRRLAWRADGVEALVERDEADRWQLLQPFTGQAPRASEMLGALELRGYRTPLTDQQRAELHLGPGLSGFWVEVAWEAPGSKLPPEPPEGVDDETAPEPAAPLFRQVRLYFGAARHGEVPVLRVEEGAEHEVFWIPLRHVAQVFRSPRALQETRSIETLRRADQVKRIEVSHEGGAVELLRDVLHWEIVGDERMEADQRVVEDLRDRTEGLRGVPITEEADLADLRLDENSASASVTWTIVEGDEQQQIIYRFGIGRHGYVAVLTQREGTDDRLYWVRADDVAMLLMDPSDFRHMEPFEATVRQVLISWRGKSDGVHPKDPYRTREQAAELVEQIMAKARDQIDIVDLQRRYNEDSVLDNEYEVNQDSPFVQPFKRLASQLEPGEVGYAESQFGFHILKRVN